MRPRRSSVARSPSRQLSSHSQSKATSGSAMKLCLMKPASTITSTAGSTARPSARRFQNHAKPADMTARPKSCGSFMPT